MYLIVQYSAYYMTYYICIYTQYSTLVRYLNHTHSTLVEYHLQYYIQYFIVLYTFLKLFPVPDVRAIPV